MHGGQVHITHIAGVIVVLDRAGSPVVGLQDEVIARLDPTGHRDIRVPAVMDIFVFGDRLVEVDFDQRFGHGLAPGRMAWCVRSSLVEPGETGNTLDDVWRKGCTAIKKCGSWLACDNGVSANNSMTDKPLSQASQLPHL